MCELEVNYDKQFNKKRVTLSCKFKCSKDILY